MPDVETELRRYVEATVERVRPVTADEARERERVRARRRSWFAPDPRTLMLAATLAGLLGVAGVVAAAAPWDNDTRVATDAPSAQALTLDGHRDWFISLYDGTINPSDAEIESRFRSAFLDVIPPADVRSTSASVANTGSGWIVLRELDRRGDAAAIQLVASNGEQVLLALSLDDDGRVRYTSVRHAVPCAAPTDPDTAPLAGPLADRLQWYLDVINSDRAVSDEEITSVFAPGFVEAVPPEEFRAVTAEVRAEAPLTVRFFEGNPTSQSLVARLGTHIGREVQLTISLESEEPWRISGLAIRPDQQPCRLPTD